MHLFVKCLIALSCTFACFHASGCSTFPKTIRHDRYKAESIDIGDCGSLIVAVSEKSQLNITRILDIVKESLEKREISHSKPSSFTYRENEPLQLPQKKVLFSNWC